MTKLEEAIETYPIGTVIRSMSSGDTGEIIEIFQEGNNVRTHNRGGNGFQLYDASSDKWAEIISKPIEELYQIFN